MCIKRRTAATPPFKQLGLWEMSKIKHSEQINPCRKIVTRCTQQELAMLAAWHPDEHLEAYMRIYFETLCELLILRQRLAGQSLGLRLSHPEVDIILCL